MELSSKLSISIIDDFKNLTEHLSLLNELVVSVDANLPAWFKCPSELINEDTDNYRVQISRFLNQVEYLDSQPPKEILLGPGWLSCSNETLEMMETVNNLKLKFKSSIIKLKNASDRKYVSNEFESFLNKRPISISNRLSKIGLSRLHLKQCYRQIPTLTKMPKKISWTWANTKAITKISKQQALDLMTKKSKSPEINFQLNKLHNHPNDQDLAIVQTLSPHLRANLIIPDDGDNIFRKMIKGAMPICFPHEPDRIPQINPPKEKQGHNPDRITRSDVKLESEPFLPAIRVFRYKVFNTEQKTCTT
ncbi:MAG: DNA replication terminus site-binding family protein [Francisellaceae bacterium]|jgi:hypothetical protein|nr:DNA replication terminus site-binding family protein [Francisellaceae bacterium]MBT6539015.1 DNA replication terminus site-binding family protein [Francisellaceae bacterium]